MIKKDILANIGKVVIYDPDAGSEYGAHKPHPVKILGYGPYRRDENGGWTTEPYGPDSPRRWSKPPPTKVLVLQMGGDYGPGTTIVNAAKLSLGDPVEALEKWKVERARAAAESRRLHRERDEANAMIGEFIARYEIDGMCSPQSYRGEIILTAAAVRKILDAS